MVRRGGSENTRKNDVKCMQKLRKSRDLKTRFAIRGQGEGSEERGTSARKEKRAKMQLKPMKNYEKQQKY